MLLQRTESSLQCGYKNQMLLLNRNDYEAVLGVKRVWGISELMLFYHKTNEINRLAK